MRGFVIPAVAQDNRLREMLESADPRKFATQVALSNALSLAVQRTAVKHRMRNPEVLDGLLVALVSAVQAMAPAEEWAGIGVVLADVLQRKLTVRQD